MGDRKGIELLRYAVHMLDHCNESFNQRFTGPELLRIADACQKSKWDIYPDEWDAQQIQECLLFNHVPDWREVKANEWGGTKMEPIYLRDGKKDYNIGVVFTMTATVPVRADSLGEAVEWAGGDMPLPTNGEYLDDSFEIDSDTTRESNPEEEVDAL